MSSEKILNYTAPFKSFLDTSFFQELSRLKLDVFKLDSTCQPLVVNLDLHNIPKSADQVPLFLTNRSFEEHNNRSGDEVLIRGKIFNFNVLDEFRNLDKQHFLYQRALECWEDGLKDINKCISFAIISFADLKKYRFYYWLGVPCFQQSSSAVHVQPEPNSPQIFKKYQEWFDINYSKWVCTLNEDGEIINYDKDIIGATKVLAVRDTSTMENVPSALTKNFLSVLQHDVPGLTNFRLLIIRQSEGSFALNVTFASHDAQPPSSKSDMKVTGWEKNIQGKLAPRVVDLSTLLDPFKIADQSVDLNLKLMKWRIIPDLNLDIIKNTKVLLLGAGTLGCYVSRALMAWGVRKITFVDSGTVSYSNPVRQALYNFDDYGKPKAEIAAASLKKIFPLMDASGVTLSIPMIGHKLVNEESQQGGFEKLRALIKAHDVIFLLVDSRESRWLPSLLGNIENKIVINAALGFDSYLVMRHGSRQEEPSKQLGCYFCHDVVAPTDSLTDRTLDQMCTVTRPGIAMMASSLAVELMTSLLQSKNPASETTVLGEIPHQLRGFLYNFSILKLETPAYEHCPACSPKVVEAFADLGWEFVKKALENPLYVEEVSGLSQIKQEVELLGNDVFEWEGDESDEVV
ncbi:atg7p [Saccharomyces arboricola H-6]|uniref:Ubiquitin-like modifier-activating enzyme ATG7 n=1 Tax=Saccharomyces arboricola (strain H-6 / AS 2.3317 / CBS 10644) TaxID=1160507 RepID=J8Q434_SACAR|nr:atg7p [Saccharomyces arboricola H-6]